MASSVAVSFTERHDSATVCTTRPSPMASTTDGRLATRPQLLVSSTREVVRRRSGEKGCRFPSSLPLSLDRWRRTVDATGSSRALRTGIVAVYFTDGEGLRYRVYDTTYGKGKHHQRPIGDPTATERVFVPPNKEQMLRRYTFERGESRVLEPQALARQLREAQYAPRTPPDNKDRTAREMTLKDWKPAQIKAALRANPQRRARGEDVFPHAPAHNHRERALSQAGGGSE